MAMRLMTAPDEDDVVTPLLEADEAVVQQRWAEVIDALRGVELEQRELDVRRERLEARRTLLEGLTRLRRAAVAERHLARVRDRDLTAPRDLLLAVMRATAEEHTASELHLRLHTQGITTSPSNVRRILRQLVDDGVAEQTARGRYRATTEDED
jgi:hypothetical protein